MGQFPLYERLKQTWGKMQGSETTPSQGAACGSLAGAVAAAVTTPLDVVKTRLMLNAKNASGQLYSGTLSTLQTIVREEGYAALFHGVGPRVGWITLGGYVFFGAYEKSIQALWTSGMWGQRQSRQY